MEGSYADKFAFVGEWYDSQANLMRRFNIFYYPVDETFEIYDLKNRKTFMRRMKVTGLAQSNLYLGAVLLIHGRLFKILDFACQDTKKKLHKDMEVMFALLNPIPMSLSGKILTYYYEHEVYVSKMKMARLSHDDIYTLFAALRNDAVFPFLVEYLTGKTCIGLELFGKNCIERIHELTGDPSPEKAKPGTVRALYGQDRVRNCIYISNDAKAALEAINYFFPPPSASWLRLTATLSNCTLGIIKPHAIREGNLGRILEAIEDGGFNVTALNMLVVESVNAAEFFEVYKGIVSEYKGMVEELSSGPCVAMEIVTKDKDMNTAIEFRKLVGPSDPEIARMLRPHTLRAKFGTNKIKNAVHCSDLAEDGLLEVEYFFKILAL